MTSRAKILLLHIEDRRAERIAARREERRLDAIEARRLAGGT